MKRKLFETLIKEKDSNKISIIIGPRQVGKTTLLKQLYKELGGLYLDLDLIDNLELVSSYETLINTLKLKGLSQNKFYLFLDEFQRYKDLTMILKNVYDHHENIKIYCTGSSSLAIKNQVQESLAGRKFLHELLPLDFEEFLIFKKDEEAITMLNNITKIEGENLPIKKLLVYLEEFMIYGGYPEVILSNKKEIVLKSIFDTYIKKELIEYLKIEKTLEVKRLIEYLAINNGQKIKYEKAGEICNLKQTEVKKYLNILEETFIIKIIKPFYTNKNKELVKIPKIYFIDPGTRNFYIKNYNKLNLRADAGFLFENFVVTELLKIGEELNFWEDKNQNEIDIIIDKKTKQIPIEIKFKQKLKQEDERNLKKFFKEYKEKGFLINTGVQKENKKLPFKIIEWLKESSS